MDVSLFDEVKSCSTHIYQFRDVWQVLTRKFTFKGALNALKRKKALEKQLQQIDGTLSTIEFQRQALENANTNTEVLNSMKYAAIALKDAQKV